MCTAWCPAVGRDLRPAADFHRRLAVEFRHHQEEDYYPKGADYCPAEAGSKNY